MAWQRGSQGLRFNRVLLLTTVTICHVRLIASANPEEHAFPATGERTIIEQRDREEKERRKEKKEKKEQETFRGTNDTRYIGEPRDVSCDTGEGRAYSRCTLRSLLHALQSSVRTAYDDVRVTRATYVNAHAYTQTTANVAVASANSKLKYAASAYLTRRSSATNVENLRLAAENGDAISRVCVHGRI